MNDNQRERTELGYLIARLCDGTLSPEELAQLEQTLLNNREAQAFYHDYLALDGELTWSHAQPPLSAPSPSLLALDLTAESSTSYMSPPGSGLKSCASEAESDPEPLFLMLPASRPWGRKVFAAAALLTALAASLILAVVWLYRPGISTPPPLTAAASFAQLVELVGDAEVLTSAGESTRAVVGQVLQPGQTLRIGADDGFAVIEYADHTRLELLADTVAHLSVREPSGSDPGGKKVFLSRGLLRAEVTPQPSGQPMLLSTPHAEVRILGTRFVSAIAPRATRIELEQGRLEVVRQADGQSVSVEQGTYVEASADPALKPMVTRPLPELVSRPWNVLKTSARTLAFSSDGNMLALGMKDRVSLWNLTTWSTEGPLPGQQRDLQSIAFAPKNEAVVTAGRDPIGKVWGLPEGAEIGSFQMPKPFPSCLLAGPGGKSVYWVTQGRGKVTQVKRWVHATNAIEDVGTTTVRDFQCLALSPDGMTLAGGTRNGKVVLWKVGQPEPGQEILAHRRRIHALAFSPDGLWLATGGDDGEVKIWNASTWTLRQKLEGQGRQVVSLAYSPDGSILAVGRHDGTIKLWDPFQAREMASIAHARRGKVSCLAFAPHGRILVTAIPGKPIYLWSLSTEMAPQDR